MLNKGCLFILSAPAGTGKTTLMERLSREFRHVRQSISCTTRPKRPGEIDGIHYHFVTEEAFEAKRLAGDFLEWAQVFSYHYGTSKSFVDAELNKGYHVFLVIDTQGAAQVQEKRSAVSIFLSPPSMEELKRRLASRNTEDAQSMEKRLSRSKLEMEAAKNYDYHIINDDVDEAYQALRRIVLEEEEKE